MVVARKPMLDLSDYSSELKYDGFVPFVEPLMYAHHIEGFWNCPV